jgi:hypothetical protein
MINHFSSSAEHFYPTWIILLEVGYVLDMYCIQHGYVSDTSWIHIQQVFKKISKEKLDISTHFGTSVDTYWPISQYKLVHLSPATYIYR